MIVAYEDPSCPRCGRFERNAYPQIRSNLVETGQAAFVYRGYPVVYQWGKPACQALEATYAADESAFWELKDYYYAEQRGLDAGNVHDRTETFLADSTDVDAVAVVDEARNEVYDDAVQADLDAGEGAGASGVPQFYLFRDGEFRTEISGPQDYRVFENALGL